jgi:sterol desaturase/sphingolipid hydroxylase (fatty acid hydroxylase superfamily)
MLNELIAKTTLTLSNVSWSSWSAELSGELVASVLLICFVGLSNLENRFPKISRPVRQTSLSYQTNISLFVFNSLLISVFSVSTLFIIAEHYSSNGLLNGISNPALKAILAFLAVDLLLYFWHKACHRVDCLWIFHRVHHNDPYLNVSTAFRLHFMEIIATNALKALLIVILGIDKMLVLSIETAVTLFIMFHHTNISFKYERMLGYVMIVPFLHRVHHSTERSEHDSNYGAMLSVWDRLFGTLLEVEPKRIGIKGNSPQDVYNLIKFGFNLERPDHVQSVNLDMMIAEAAYYKAEKRNFYPGNDLRDWLEAKADIVRIYEKKTHPGQTVADYFKVMPLKFQQIFGQQSLKSFMPANFLWH